MDARPLVVSACKSLIIPEMAAEVEVEEEPPRPPHKRPHEDAKTSSSSAAVASSSSSSPVTLPLSLLSSQAGSAPSSSGATGSMLDLLLPAPPSRRKRARVVPEPGVNQSTVKSGARWSIQDDGPFLERPEWNTSWRLRDYWNDVDPSVPDRFALDPEVDDDDTLSNIPDDALTKVFTYLDRRSIDIMKRVSQKMNFFAQQPTAHKIKRYMGEIQIVQNRMGHAVHVRSGNPAFHSYVMSVRCHSVDPGTSADAVTKADAPRRFTVKRFKYIGYDHPSLEEYVNYHAIDPRNHDFAVPRVLFSKLNWLIQHQFFTTLKFVRVVIDGSFIYHCSYVFRRVSRYQLFFDNAVIEPALKASDVKALRDFLLNSKLHSLSVEQTPLEKLGILDEDYIKRMVHNPLNKSYTLRIVSSQSDADRVRFHPDESILKTMVHYSCLKLHSLTLPVDWMIQAMINRMDIGYCTGEWKFCLDSMIDPGRHCTARAMQGKAKYAFTTDTSRHEIRRTDNHNFVGFTVTLYQAHIYILTAAFLHNPEQSFIDRFGHPVSHILS